MSQQRVTRLLMISPNSMVTPHHQVRNVQNIAPGINVKEK